MISLFFVHWNVIQLRRFWLNYFLNKFILLVGLFETSLFVDGRYQGTSWLSTSKMYVGIDFLLSHVLQEQFLYCLTWSRNQFLSLNISFLFLQTLLVINSISLYFDYWIFGYLLPNLFLRFWLFLVLCWLLWMLFTLRKLCPVPHASQIISGTVFME